MPPRVFCTVCRARTYDGEVCSVCREQLSKQRCRTPECKNLGGHGTYAVFCQRCYERLAEIKAHMEGGRPPKAEEPKKPTKRELKHKKVEENILKLARLVHEAEDGAVNRAKAAEALGYERRSGTLSRIVGECRKRGYLGPATSNTYAGFSKGPVAPPEPAAEENTEEKPFAYVADIPRAAATE